MVTLTFDVLALTLLVSRGERGAEWGGSFPLLSLNLGSGMRASDELSEWGLGRAPAENVFL